ncbi:hypothetical protein OM341_05285 [Escherichia albertii]|nr:hypothetical protein [Escherichia albertii]MCZ9209275.1 hypothetical protein [Escherichia albertii]
MRKCLSDRGVKNWKDITV